MISPQLTKTFLPSTVLAALALGSLAAAAARAQGDLLVAPKRVVFEGRDRSTEIMLVNRSSETKTYRLLFAQMRMDPSGKLRPSPASAAGTLAAERPASPLVRFAPRRVVLEPDAVQTVRLQVRKPSDLEAGEYRSHLVFRVVPGVDAGSSVEPSDEEKKLSIRLTPVLNVAIPVLVRHGALQGSLSIAGIGLLREEGEARFRLERTGDRSFYGDLTATLYRADGSSTVLGRAKGIAVYTPNPVREVRLPLSLPEDWPPSGRLEIAYSEVTAAGGKRLASGELAWP